MIIHVVQAGETTNEIAEIYGISAERLIKENEISNPDNLTTGETLVILIPQVTHIIQEGDTLSGIASDYGITVLQLLRNNPYLSNREFIYPGEMIVISYQGEKLGRLSTYGYAYPFINIDVLKKTLPFLTYITIYSYTFTEEGEINDIDDTEIIQISKEYQVAPIMILTAGATNQADISNVMQNLLLSQENQDQFIYNVLNMLKAKGYYGVNINVSYILPQNRSYYVEFIIKFTNQMKSEGFVVFNTLSLTAFEIMTGTIYEGFEYSEIAQSLEGLLLMTYEWGNLIDIPTGIIAFDNIIQYVQYMSERFPAEKMLIGVPILGYLWELPYVLGISKGLAISSNAAVELANTVGAEIQYDEITKVAYFQYISGSEYIVRFRDARSVNEYLKVVLDFGLNGIAIWNINFFYPQLWLVVNSQFEINNLFEQ
jgi:spore germination protein